MQRIFCLNCSKVEKLKHEDMKLASGFVLFAIATILKNMFLSLSIFSNFSLLRTRLNCIHIYIYIYMHVYNYILF